MAHARSHVIYKAIQWRLNPFPTWGAEIFCPTQVAALLVPFIFSGFFCSYAAWHCPQPGAMPSASSLAVGNCRLLLGTIFFSTAKVKCLRPALDFSLWRHGYMGTCPHVASIPSSESSKPERNGSPQKLFMSPDFCQERPKGLRFLLIVPMGFLQGVIIWLAFEAPGDGVWMLSDRSDKWHRQTSL